ncbi:MAG: YezD family protein [Alcanivorax sp.]|nr:YezD family protein [Alcanivorax sp.]|tara:strand:- start:1455 stop:1628 length:174 start_codon:yes stop_codon:yes gene_type:complete
MARPDTHRNPASEEVDLATLVTSLIKDLRFGAVEITVHEGRVVQVERKEKYRFDKPR